jgi:predicted PurR-regulated permease PerM
MDTSLFIVIVLVLVGFAVILAFINKKFTDLGGKDDSASFLMLNQNIQGMQERLDKTTSAINDRLDKAAQVISGVQRELGGVQEIGHSMKELQDFLRSP